MGLSDFVLDQRREAAAILSTATARTDEAVWAVGVTIAHYPANLVRAWDGGALIDTAMQGTSLAGRRHLVAESGRISVVAQYGGPAVFTVAESAVRRLVDARRLPVALVAEVRALGAERAAHAVADVDRFHREQRGAEPRTDAERAADFRRYCDIELRCTDAAARVWAAVRPAAAALFDLPAAHLTSIGA